MIPSGRRTIPTTRKSPYGIAFIIGQLGLGGAEQQLYYLISGLDRSRFRPLAMTLGPSSGEYWEEPIRGLGVTVACVPRSSGSLRRSFLIAGLLREHGVDIVHSWTFHTNPYAALAGRLAGVPLRLGSMRGGENARVLSSTPFLQRLGYWGLDRLVANSTPAAEHVRASRPGGPPISVVHNGVLAPPPLTDAKRRRLRSDLGCSADQLLIGTVGRLDSNKNHSMLLRAMAMLSRKHPTLSLVIIGDGPLRSQLVAQADELALSGRVLLSGLLPSAARYLAAMDICCLTSYTEGMPNVIMEASAAGLPVVSTSCGGGVELIQDGVTGFLVPADDHRALSEHLNSLLSDPLRRHEMGEAGRNRMRDEFSVESMVANMTRIFDQSLAEKGLE